MSDVKQILVTGAGVDRTNGIDFPLVTELLPAINRYLTQDEEGKQVEQLLRANINGLRFRFDRFINNAINEITKQEPSQLKATITRVDNVVQTLSAGANDRVKKQGQLLVKLFNQLQQIASANVIDEETQKLIEDVFEDKVAEFTLDDSIVDIRTLNVSETFKAILRYTLRQSLDSDSNPIAKALGIELLNIEQLLIDKFLGFYNNKLSDIKNYVYISWCLWAYLLHKDQEIAKRGGDLPFYAQLGDDWRAVTLNYTSFIERKIGLENTVYFHGNLAKSIRMDNRELMSFGDISSSVPHELLRSHICKNWKFNDEDPIKSVCLIPSIIPPLRLKPVLSANYIEIWHRANTWLKAAECIVIIGYSLNSADEHFNDLLRNLLARRIIIIDPNALSESYKMRVSAIWGVNPSQLTGTKVQDHDAAQWQRITLVAALADQIDLEELKLDLAN